MALPRVSRPNIVYLMGDCFKFSATAMGGNCQAVHPFISRLAAGGVSFNHAYATNPICTPSRVSVFTGVHPLVHQCTCHQHRAPLNLPQLSELFLQAGYYTAACGHYELNRNLSRGWVEQCDEAATGCLRESYLKWQRSGRRDLGWPSGTLEMPAEDSNSHLITDRALRMLDSAKAMGAPFFLHVSYNDPHSPYFAPPPYDKLIDPALVQMPNRGGAEECPAWHQAALDVFRTAEATEADLRRLIATYYGMIAHLDNQFRRLHDGLAARGMLDNTWFVISSDHGDYVAEKGMFSHTESLYECLLHVPLVICPPPGVSEPRGRGIDGLVDLVDLFPTMLGIAGIKPPDYAQGHDLMKWVRSGAASPLRKQVFAQVGDYHGHLGDSLPGGRPGCTRHPGLIQGVRTQEWAFVRDPDFGNEAYDLRQDPCELRNLLNRPGASLPEPLAKLEEEVGGWEESCLALRRELGVLPGYRGFDKGWE